MGVSVTKKMMISISHHVSFLYTKKCFYGSNVKNIGKDLGESKCAIFLLPKHTATKYLREKNRQSTCKKNIFKNKFWAGDKREMIKCVTSELQKFSYLDSRRCKLEIYFTSNFECQIKERNIEIRLVTDLAQLVGEQAITK